MQPQQAAAVGQEAFAAPVAPVPAGAPTGQSAPAGQPSCAAVPQEDGQAAPYEAFQTHPVAPPASAPGYPVGPSAVPSEGWAQPTQAASSPAGATQPTQAAGSPAGFAQPYGASPVPAQPPYGGARGSAYTPAQPGYASASGQVPPQQPWDGQPYAGGYPAQMPPRKKRTGLYVGIGVTVVVLIALVAAVGAFVLPELLASDDVPASERIEGKDRDDPSADVEGTVGAGDSDTASEEAVRAAATDLLDQLADADPDVLAQIGAIAGEGFQNQMEFPMESCGINPIDYASTMLEGFTYEINAVHADEDSAIVTATIDCRDVFSLIDNFNAMLETYVNSEAYQTSSVEEDLERVGYIFMDAARSAEMWGGYPLSLQFSKSGGAWTVDEAAWVEELDYLFDVE